MFALSCSSPMPLPRICRVVPLFKVTGNVACPFVRTTRPLPICQMLGRAPVEEVLKRSESPAKVPRRMLICVFDPAKLEKTKLFRSNTPLLNVDVYPPAVWRVELVNPRTRSTLPAGAEAGSQLAGVL